MKKLLMTLGVAAVATMALNAFADDALLSPRAAGNQVKYVAGVNNDVNLLTDHYTMTMAPRAAGGVASIAGTSSEVNPVLACRNMIASPRAIQICAMTPGMPGCKTETAAANP
jgi:hypothetical protein